MARTVRPLHNKTTPKARAARLGKTVRREGLVTKAEIVTKYRRVINTDGVSEAEVERAAHEAAALIPSLDEQVSVERNGNLLFNNKRIHLKRETVEV
jgi:hypothetical protein